MGLLLDQIDWGAVEAGLDSVGWSRISGLLSASECDELIGLYGRDGRFRSTVAMERHGYGRGEYRYFRYPLPGPISRLRGALYAGLAPIANRWSERLRREVGYPDSLAAYLEQCHAAGQNRPTPLLLRYGAGDYNRLHQDLYGSLSFPLQVVVPLSTAGSDYEGGEFTLTEQAARQQARVTVLRPGRGDAVVFPNALRPEPGARGDRRVTVRHGMSALTRGNRYALGLIFHDAE